uniref:Uncharacterized protein n=1 Tax=Zea mays TaxID=4577 RepID=B6SLE8_MAIZE|nr:hypothetical protein [Zea mays]ACG48675.1 hypothetical protein [Zea mays]
MGYWWHRVVLPVRRAWLGVSSRFGVRQTGTAQQRRDAGGSRLWRLRQEVSTCEYEDVHVMWEMLSRTTAPAPAPTRRQHSRFRPQPRPRPWGVKFRLCRGF